MTPPASPTGFTDTVSVPGVEPLTGETDSQFPVDEALVVYGSTPPALVMFKVCEAGLAPPML